MERASKENFVNLSATAGMVYCGYNKLSRIPVAFLSFLHPTSSIPSKAQARGKEQHVQDMRLEVVARSMVENLIRIDLAGPGADGTSGRSASAISAAFHQVKKGLVNQLEQSFTVVACEMIAAYWCHSDASDYRDGQMPVET